MNCQKCGIEIDGMYGSGKYCNRSCANSRQHLDKTKQKISISLLKEKYCYSCKDIISERKKYCSECHKYTKNIILFNKLKIKETNLQKANHIALDKLKNLYFNNHMSTLEIYEKFNIKENTLFWFFKKNNIPLRNNSQAQNNGIKSGRVKPLKNIHTHYKEGWHTTWFNTKVYLRSSYEYKVAQHLDNKRVYYEVESKKIPFFYKNEEHIYIPDFWIPDWNLLIETKGGYFYNRDKEKIKQQILSAENKGYLTLLLVDSQVDTYIKK